MQFATFVLNDGFVLESDRLFAEQQQSDAAKEGLGAASANRR